MTYFYFKQREWRVLKIYILGFRRSNVAEIYHFIYAQYIICIGRVEEKILNHDMWTGENLAMLAAMTPGGPREGAAHHPMWARLCIRIKQLIPLYRYTPNTT
jgi:hypothetical protein